MESFLPCIDLLLLLVCVLNGSLASLRGLTGVYACVTVWLCVCMRVFALYTIEHVYWNTNWEAINAHEQKYI